MLMDIKQLACHLNIKESTLYAWASKKKIPRIKIHGLIRFKKEDVEKWLKEFSKDHEKSINFKASKKNIDSVIARAMRESYNGDRGRPDRDRAKKED